MQRVFHAACADRCGTPRDSYDVAAAGSPRVPEGLREQLAVSGRLVIPVAGQRGVQDLIRVRRVTAE